MGGMHKIEERGEGSIPIRTILHKKGFEKTAQDVGEARKQVVMLVTWGCHTPEWQFTGDVAERIQKIKGERDIKIHELKSFTHWDDIADEHWEKTGKDYSDRKQFALQKTEHFQNLRAYNEMLKVAREEGASVIVDLHYSPFAGHAPWSVYTNSKLTKLESNPIVYVDADSKEVFEEYSRIPGINVTFKEAPPGVKSLKRVDRLKAFLRRFDYRDEKAVEDALREHRHVNLEGFVFHLPHKEGEKCEIGREEYKKVVASAADTVVRIYDHFNSKLLKKELAKGGVETSVGIVKLREEPGIREIGRSYQVILKPSGSSEERKIGTVYAIFEKVGDIDYFQPRYILIERGLREGDRIANISSFAPFWELTKELAPEVEKPIQERFMHKGIGTAAMSLLLDELKSEGIIGVYCQTGVKEMRGLLKKFEFQEICETAYFKRF